MADPLIELLHHQLQQAFDRRSWHGTNLMGSLRGVGREEAGWRPDPRRHSIAELVVHAAYWKYRVHRLISTAPPRSFDLAGSNFFARPGEPEPEEWQADVQLLRDWHARLSDAVAAFPPRRLADIAGRGPFSYAELIGGAAAHDLYHAGQIQLLKRLRSHAVLAVVAAGCVLAGCGAADDGGTVAAAEAAVSRDSAGVAIIENPERTDLLPVREVLRIGSVDGDEAYELFGIFHVAVDEHGYILVGMRDGIRVFDAEGAFVRRIGSRGSGPGEFGMAPSIWFAGDTIVALDRNRMRTTAFDADGRVIATHNAAARSGLRVQPRAANGSSWIAEVSTAADLDAVVRVDAAAGTRWDPPPIALLPLDPRTGELGDTLFRVPRAPLSGSPGSEYGVVRPLFSRDPVYAFDGAGNLFHTSAAAYRIDVHDASGAHVRSIRRAYEQIPIVGADVDDVAPLLVDGMLATMTLYGQTPDQYRQEALPRQHELIQRQAQAAPLPGHRAPLGELRVSAGGTIAVERADALAPAVNHARMATGRPLPPTRWDLFDAAGHYRGTVDLPAGFRLFAVTDDGLLVGVSRDDLGVEYVVTFQVLRYSRADPGIVLETTHACPRHVQDTTIPGRCA